MAKYVGLILALLGIFSFLLAEMSKLTPDDILKLRENNFSDRFVRSVQQNGYLHSSLQEIIRLRKNNIEETMIIKYIQSPLKISVNDLIRLRESNFRREFLQTMIVRGYSDRVAIGEMIRLKNARVSEAVILNLAYPGEHSIPIKDEP